MQTDPNLLTFSGATAERTDNLPAVDFTLLTHGPKHRAAVLHALTELQELLASRDPLPALPDAEAQEVEEDRVRDQNAYSEDAQPWSPDNRFPSHRQRKYIERLMFAVYEEAVATVQAGDASDLEYLLGRHASGGQARGELRAKKELHALRRVFKEHTDDAKTALACLRRLNPEMPDHWRSQMILEYARDMLCSEDQTGIRGQTTDTIPRLTRRH